MKCLILFKGSATDKILSLLSKKHDYYVYVVSSMKEAFVKVKETAKRGDIVLLSPGAASFGVFANEFDRGQKFNDEVKKIK